MTRTTEQCYLKSNVCTGTLWECSLCGFKFCTGTHSHSTSKGLNTECRYCERKRKEEAILGASPAITRIETMLNSINKLNFGK
jgi:hypothetical protein